MAFDRSGLCGRGARRGPCSRGSGPHGPRLGLCRCRQGFRADLRYRRGPWRSLGGSIRLHLRLRFGLSLRLGLYLCCWFGLSLCLRSYVCRRFGLLRLCLRGRRRLHLRPRSYLQLWLLLRLSRSRLMAYAVRGAPGRLHLRRRVPVPFRAAVAGRAFLSFRADGLGLGGLLFRGGVLLRRLLPLLVLLVFFRYYREVVAGHGEVRSLIGGWPLRGVRIGRRLRLNRDAKVGVSLLVTRLPSLAPPSCGEEIPSHQRHVNGQKDDDGYIKAQSGTSCAHHT